MNRAPEREPQGVSPIDAANAITPHWMRNIKAYDGLEIRPCAIGGRDGNADASGAQCAPQDAALWTVYGHRPTGDFDAFQDFPTQAEARAFHDRVIAVYPHLVDGQMHAHEHGMRR